MDFEILDDGGRGSIEPLKIDISGGKYEPTEPTDEIPIKEFGPIDLPKPTKKSKFVDYDVPISAIYDRRRDGSYTAKFKNYKGAYDNEDRLAKEQGALEKLGKGVLRVGAKASLYAVDAIVGTAVGITDAINSGDYSDVWDNDFSNAIDEWNKSVDYTLPVHHSNEYKNQNILENIFYNPATFIGSDLADGLAFVGGALLPEAALAALSGGATLPTSLAKVGGRLGLKSAKRVASKRAVNLENKLREVGVDSKRMYEYTKLGATVGDIGRTAGFLVRTSNFEASVEARHNFHDAVEEYVNSYEHINGALPSIEEMSDFMDTARQSANNVHMANMAILSVSNTAMFGARFGILKPQRAAVNSFGNKLIGLKPKKLKTGGFEKLEPTRGQKIIGNTYKVLSKPAIEGLYEEGLQGVAGETMQHYLQSTYDESFSDTYDIWSALSDGFSQTYGTKEGWKEIGLGMIIGFMGGSTFQRRAPEGLGKDSYSSRVNDVNKAVEKANTAHEKFYSSVGKRDLFASSAKSTKEVLSKADPSDIATSDVKGSLLTLQYLRAQEGLKSEDDLLMEYKTVLESTKFDKETTEQLGGEQGVSEYKDALIADFAKTQEDYRRAKAVVRNLGLDTELKKSPGNTKLVKNYLETALVIGEASGRSAETIGNMIESIVGEEGIYNAVKFYAELSQDHEKQLNELRTKEKELEKLRSDHEVYSRKLAGIMESPGLSDKTLEKRRNEVAEKRVLTATKIIELEQEINTAEELLSNRQDVGDIRLETDPLDIGVFETATENLKKLDKLENFAQTLIKAGNQSEADALFYLVNQFKELTDAKREVNNTLRKMADTNFLTSNRGQGFLGRILGTRYTMDESFKEKLKENDEVIDRQMRKVGIRDYGTVEEHLKKVLEDNDNLSDREKFRLETILRMQLNLDSVGATLERKLSTPESKAEKEAVATPLDGDTIGIVESIRIDEEGETDIEVLGEAIDSMVKAIEDVRQKLRDEQETPTRPQETEEETKQQEEQETEGQQEPTTEFKGTPYRIVESEDYQRLDELLTRKHKGEELSLDELQEIEDLQESIDQWMFATGVVVGGYRLSDLIRLKNQLENTPIEERSKVVIPDKVVVARDAMSFRDVENTPHYDLVQQPTHVTAVSKNIGGRSVIVLSGLNYEDLQEVAGRSFERLNVNGFAEYETKRNNTVISEETREELNRDSNLIINPPADNTRNYAITLQRLNTGELVPLQSNFRKDFTDAMDTEITYTLKSGDPVKLTVDPNDSHNKVLLDNYRENPTEETLEALKEGLVIRTSVRGEGNKFKFNGYLKAKRETKRKGKVDIIFEKMRNQIINDSDFLDKILNIEGERPLPVTGKVAVKKVFLGHPNFYYVESAEGQFEIESRRFDDQSVTKVVDIGYMEKGKNKTRSGELNMNTTFLESQKRKSENAKVPFVVIEKSGERIAYPVEVLEGERPDPQDVVKIFESDASNESKVERLNNLLAERGVNIRGKGQAFTFRNIEDTEFLREKVAQLENIKYFYDVGEWTNKSSPMEDILKDQVLIDINMSEPFISPKMQLDYSELRVKNTTEGAKQANKKSEDGGRKKKEAKEKREEPCKKKKK